MARGLLYVVLGLVGLTLAGGAAAQPIGTAVLIERWAYGTPPQMARRDLVEQDAVVADELLETVEYGALQVRLADNTDFRLGSASSAVLDSFVYNPSANTGEILINVGKGVFRYVSGDMDLGKEAFQIRTPDALIGVRGTDLFVFVGLFGTIVQVLIGAAEVALLDGSSSALATPQSNVGAGGPDGGLRSGVEAPDADAGVGNDGNARGGERSGADRGGKNSSSSN